ncbi:MAG: GNAT family N-acetyltransferase [Solirubrobacteraceae bacterium]
MDGITFRVATADDVDAVLAFWQVAAEDAHRPADDADAVARLLFRDPDALLLAVDDDELVGTIVIGWDGWRCHLYRLAVHPAYRRLGIARTLLAIAEDRFRAFDGTRADAMVLDANDEAHTLWTASGYTRQAEWSRWIKPLD